MLATAIAGYETLSLYVTTFSSPKIYTVMIFSLSVRVESLSETLTKYFRSRDSHILASTDSSKLSMKKKKSK